MLHLQNLCNNPKPTTANWHRGSEKKPLSKDGQWRSFPNVPCLRQYVSNGNYYGRIRVNGKLIRASLKVFFARRQDASRRLNRGWREQPRYLVFDDADRYDFALAANRVRSSSAWCANFTGLDLFRRARF